MRLSLPYQYHYSICDSMLHLRKTLPLEENGESNTGSVVSFSFVVCGIGSFPQSTCSPHWPLTMYPIMTLNSSCLCLWAEITSMSQNTQMHILLPITIFEAGVPHSSFPKKHLTQGHYGTSHTAYHTKGTNLQSNYNVKEITSWGRNDTVQIQVINTRSSSL